MYKSMWFCRWCGYRYNPTKRTDRDGFCCTSHKQAHHRAYKNYVTGKTIATVITGGSRAIVTQKKPPVITAIARATRDVGKMLAKKKRKKLKGAQK